jgi:hypothetical protein
VYVVPLLFSVRTLFVVAAFVTVPFLDEEVRAPELEVDLLDSATTSPLALFVLLPELLATTLVVDLRPSPVLTRFVPVDLR